MEIIDHLTEEQGMSQEQAEAAAGACLHLIRSKSSDQGFEVIQECIPEAEGWMQVCTEGDAEPQPIEKPMDNDEVSNEDEGVREAAQVEHFDPSGGMGEVFEEALEAFHSAREGHHMPHLAGLVASFKTLGLEGASAAEAGPPMVAFLHERLGDDSFRDLVREVPLLEHLATGGTGRFTDGFTDHLRHFFGHHHRG